MLVGGPGSDKYGLAQADFYQLLAYGQGDPEGRGDIVLICPRTDRFEQPLPVFEFPKTHGLRLWVLPFCLKTRSLEIPADARLSNSIRSRANAAAAGQPPLGLHPP